MKKFHLELGEPIIVYQGEVGDNAWGHTQFPTLKYSDDGNIICSWKYTSDTVDYEEIDLFKVSKDNGKSWITENATPKYVEMNNGKKFVGFLKKPAHQVDYLDKYTPVYSDKKQRLFYANDILEDEDKKVYGIEIDNNGNKTVFECKINWPNMPMWAPEDKIYPLTMMFHLCEKTGLYLINNDMYFVIYMHNLNANAKSKDESLLKRMDVTGVYVFKSIDNARTWNYVSQVLPNDENYSNNEWYNGFCEAMMTKVPDGSITMLMRSGGTTPSYYVHSLDNCKTWSKPRVFDEFGVLPQILSLPCGVTIATYGRPGVRIRATSDPSCHNWENPIDLPLSNSSEWNKSCGYTSLLPLTDTTALLADSDFHFEERQKR